MGANGICASGGAVDALRAFQVKLTGSVENARKTKRRADFTQVEAALRAWKPRSSWRCRSPAAGGRRVDRQLKGLDLRGPLLDEIGTKGVGQHLDWTLGRPAPVPGRNLGIGDAVAAAIDRIGPYFRRRAEAGRRKAQESRRETMHSASRPGFAEAATAGSV
jgi:hypothetical protein